jgi:guanine nucleotide-binding protein subunit alpha
VTDVGGQRGERRKWIHLFDNVDAVLFICALSDYDTFVDEDRATNALAESLQVFEGLMRSPHFTETEVLLILNKDDLFRAKIAERDMRPYFPDYSGGCDYQRALDYILFEFKRRALPHHPELRYFVTTATHTENFEKVWALVRKIVVLKNLQRAQLT